VIVQILPEGDIYDLMAFVEINHGCDKSSCLRNDRCHSGSRNPPLKNNHKKQIKYNIGNRGDDQKIKRGFRIAHSAENSAGGIKSNKENRPGKVNIQIKLCLGNNFFREVGKPEDGFAENNPKNGNENGRKKQDNVSCVNGSPHFFDVFTAEILGDDNRKTRGNSNDHGYQQKDDRERCSNGGQCFITDIIPNNYAVGNIIKLLKNIAKNHRQSKLKNQLPFFSNC